MEARLCSAPGGRVLRVRICTMRVLVWPALSSSRKTDDHHAVRSPRRGVLGDAGSLEQGGLFSSSPPYARVGYTLMDSSFQLRADGTLAGEQYRRWWPGHIQTQVGEIVLPTPPLFRWSSECVFLRGR